MTTVKEIKAELDKLGIAYNPGDKKAVLEKKLTKDDEVKPKVEDKKVKDKPQKQAVKLPIFENKQVLKVLDSGHIKTHFHCLLEGGVTMHVPKKLFS